MRWRLGFALCAVLTVGCASGGTSGARGGLQNPSLITRADIERAHAGTALDAVQRYRADLLTPHAPSSILLNKQTYPVVFMDAQVYGQIDSLRDIAADGIEEIRLFSGPDAARTFGAQYGGGVIQLISRTGASGATG